MELRVSIIMAAFDAEAHVRPALDSALGQTFQAWELIFIDDGSRDGTLDIAREYERKDSRIRVIHQANQGPSKARNAGIAVARSNWVAILDADDIATPGRLSLQMRFLEEHPTVGMVGGTMREIDGFGRETGVIYAPPLRDREIRERIFQGCPFLHSTVVARRETVLKVGGYRPQFPPANDYDLWLRLMNEFELANLSEVCGLYRVHWASDSYRNLLKHAITSAAAVAAARLRQQGRVDPSDEAEELEPHILRKLGLTDETVAVIKSKAILAAASKMVSLGSPASATKLLCELESISLPKHMENEVQANKACIEARVMLKQRRYGACLKRIGRSLVRDRKLFPIVSGKVFRQLRRIAGWGK